jgi:hypothetical protein
MLEIKNKPVEGPIVPSASGGSSGKEINLPKESLPSTEGLRNAGAKENAAPSPSKDMLGKMLDHK